MVPLDNQAQTLNTFPQMIRSKKHPDSIQFWNNIQGVNPTSPEACARTDSRFSHRRSPREEPIRLAPEETPFGNLNECHPDPNFPTN